jgi:hypothetical protein
MTLPNMKVSSRKLRPDYSGVLDTPSRNSPYQLGTEDQGPTTNKGTPVLRKEVKRETDASS